LSGQEAWVKPQVGIAVIHKLAAKFKGAVRFVDLGSLTDPALVSSAISAALGLSVKSANPTADLITFLRHERTLLLLDSCDPVLDGTAIVAERLYQGCPTLHLLATSREAMRVEGEQVVQLPPLQSPPALTRPGIEELLEFPAVQLFSERLVASGRQIRCPTPTGKLSLISVESSMASR
jgi:predicted ATPase